MSEPAVATAVYPCALCQAPVAKEAVRYVNQQPACEACVAQLQREVEEQQPVPSTFPPAAALGLVGALVGACVWAAVAVSMNLEVGYIAVLVGFGAGFGVKLGAGKKRGMPLQVLAVGLSIVGLLAAKYFTFTWVLVKMAHDKGVDISYFDGRILAAFPDALKEMASPFDILWIVIAIGAAYRVPKAPRVVIQ